MKARSIKRTLREMVRALTDYRETHHPEAYERYREAKRVLHDIAPKDFVRLCQEAMTAAGWTPTPSASWLSAEGRS